MRNGERADVIKVCEVTDLPPGEGLRVEKPPGSLDAIAVFNVDGEFLAIDDTCTHQDASLADGYLEGCAVECPLHASCFDLRTGAVTGLPAKVGVRTHRTTVKDGVLYVAITVPAGSPASSAASSPGLP